MTGTIESWLLRRAVATAKRSRCCSAGTALTSFGLLSGDRDRRPPRMTLWRSRLSVRGWHSTNWMTEVSR